MNQIIQVPIKAIRAGDNDRTHFDPDALKTLAESIRKNGLAQPILLNLYAPDPRSAFGGDPRGPLAQYTIIAGERRFRACKLLNMDTIPAIIAEISEEEAAALMLTENVSRADLDPIDEGRAYKIRMDKFGWSIEECAQAAGTSKIRVQFRLKLLTLIPELQHLIRSGNLPIGYAQILADSGLDSNRQLLAVKALRDNPRPTPGWFRNIVNQYVTQQNQATMFDSALLVCQELPTTNTLTDPPHPSTTTPPIYGTRPLDILKNQAEFWKTAATAWAEIGKPFKKQECEAAALAVLYAANQFTKKKR